MCEVLSCFEGSSLSWDRSHPPLPLPLLHLHLHGQIILQTNFFFRKIPFYFPFFPPGDGKGMHQRFTWPGKYKYTAQSKSQGGQVYILHFRLMIRTLFFSSHTKISLILLIKNICSCRLGSSLWTALRRRWGACKHSSAGSVRVNYTSHFACRLGG